MFARCATVGMFAPSANVAMSARGANVGMSAPVANVLMTAAGRGPQTAPLVFSRATRGLGWGGRGPQTAPLVFSTATRGLGSEFGAAADGAPFVAPSLAPYPGPSAAPKLLERGMGIGKGMEALILAQSCVLLSRALAYVGLADLDCARALAVEIRDHLDAINCYALAKGIGLELAEAQLNLISVTGDFAVNDTTADIAVSDRSA